MSSDTQKFCDDEHIAYHNRAQVGERSAVKIRHWNVVKKESLKILQTIFFCFCVDVRILNHLLFFDWKGRGWVISQVCRVIYSLLSVFATHIFGVYIIIIYWCCWFIFITLYYGTWKLLSSSDIIFTIQQKIEKKNWKSWSSCPHNHFMRQILLKQCEISSLRFILPFSITHGCPVRMDKRDMSP